MANAKKQTLTCKTPHGGDVLMTYLNTCRVCGLSNLERGAKGLRSPLIQFGPRHHAHADCGLAKWGAKFFDKLTPHRLHSFPAMPVIDAKLEPQLRAALQARPCNCSDCQADAVPHVVEIRGIKEVLGAFPQSTPARAAADAMPEPQPTAPEPQAPAPGVTPPVPSYRSPRANGHRRLSISSATQDPARIQAKLKLLQDAGIPATVSYHVVTTYYLDVRLRDVKQASDILTAESKARYAAKYPGGKSHA